ncbi:YkgJ family cysteine cluster protein [Halolamina sp. CBA1230]|uniref:YkgJ family cysteine cluster protein n=1 Tax=Halolamina sp. CBA1230 TaxID=1853690 RepID=UPI0009A20A96|nr:YkgJ family cysteine cluster protein [Halolamina sp. CBA1230]QKY20358.1 YkgJ family cysteine cluster protein [Halolamina sp. CBA1230]
MSLTDELERARELDTAELADAIESIGFECTRCGACCTREETEDGDTEPHTATVFPDEVRTLQEAGDEDREWRDVARPMPYGLDDGEGETFEWALQTDACGDCVFYEEEDGLGACTVHPDRPLICETYPFSVALDGTAEPAGDPVDSEGIVRAHECEGLGRDISREHAEELAESLKERAIRELEEAISLREQYEPVGADGEIVVHDSEGAKQPDGTPIDGGD